MSTVAEFRPWDFTDAEITPFAGTAWTFSGGSFIIRGHTQTLGLLQIGTTIATSSNCFFENQISSECSCATTPPNATPPFPPVWPYMFSTSILYGRDHLSVNLKMVRGDTFPFTINVILDGNPVDLTGGSLTMTCKYSVYDETADAVFVLTSPSDGITITDATGGTAFIQIDPTNTLDLPLHLVSLPYDIQYVDSSSNIYTVMSGLLQVYPDVTSVLPS